MILPRLEHTGCDFSIQSLCLSELHHARESETPPRRDCSTSKCHVKIGLWASRLRLQMELDALRRGSDFTQGNQTPISSSRNLTQEDQEHDDSEEGDHHEFLDKPDRFGRLAAHAYDSHFNLRAVVVGSLIGTLLCVCNVYFGLQTGSGVGLSIPASLLGFAVFRSWPKPLRRPFTPIENVLVQTVASATGAMPLGCGFTGVMPAIEFLLDKSEGAPVDLSMWRLLVWGLGLNLFGVIYAVPLRREVIVREKLKFPTGTATAVMIKVLHGKSEQDGTIRPSEQNDQEVTQRLLSNSDRHEEAVDHVESTNAGNVASMSSTIDPGSSMILLARAFALSGIYVSLLY